MPKPLPIRWYLAPLLSLSLCASCMTPEIEPPLPISSRAANSEIPAEVVPDVVLDAAPDSEAPPVAASDGPADLIILISLDTLRADHLSVYGYERPTSPALERFAETATIYMRCQATSPWTLPSHASMFTGMYAYDHGARTYPRKEVENPRRFSNTIALPEQHLTVAEVLRESGYHTGGVAANEGFLTEQYGLSQGFEHWDNGNERAPYINRRALDWLGQQPEGEPVFLFINYMDTHRPYNNQPRLDIPYHKRHGLADLAARILGEEEYTPEQVQVLIDVYDTSIANLDESLGHLFDELRRRGMYERALIVVTSDHGEFLGDHELMDHAKDVYQGAAHVPLIVKAPGQTEARVDRDWISLVHIPDLVLAYAPSGALGAIETPERETVLTELFGPRPRQKLGAWRFKRIRRALMQGDFKFIDSSDGQHELYDLTTDPGELHNLFEERDALGRRLSELLESSFGDMHVPEILQFDELTDEDLEIMRALGYAGGDDD